ncbi:Serine/threonine-protein kinase Nek9 [Nymphon striatum]|nr:Serine/threonine-protein kinase Nek9 [Nymphon striatum]
MGHEELSRLLLISNSVKSWKLVSQVVRSNVIVVLFKFDEHSLNDILELIQKTLKGVRVASFAFMLPGTEKELMIIPEKILSRKTVNSDNDVLKFFKTMIMKNALLQRKDIRVDFLHAKIASNRDSNLIIQEYENLLKVSVGMSSDLYGSDISVEINGKIYKLSKIYFDFKKTQDVTRNESGGAVMDLSGYEKIRIVGKGAFGTAVLYHKNDDDSLVILKEINMHDLSASERQLAINEVKVLSMLNHPNIISYFDSFEQDGVLMIEMEYADGGNLAQYLSQKKQRMEEKEILNFFHQMCSAMQHMHEHNILHRDLKTANIFLTKDAKIKIGDFGISKMLTTKQGGANTVLGTPYYISPEMCEGKVYNSKSDIWALGCILYEMACLQKTFEGTNLPALVNKIMKGQFAPVKGNYSPHFKKLVRDLLQKDPEFRPTSRELMLARLPELMSQYDEVNSEVEDDLITSSGLYRVKSSLIRSARIAAGKSFSVFASDNGIVMTCGDGSSGCLGHGDWNSTTRPKLIEQLLSVDISGVSCGPKHVVVNGDGDVYSWGCGEHGRLGHGDEIDRCSPEKINLPTGRKVKRVRCGIDGTMMVTTTGAILSCGLNNFNKLGLNERKGFLMQMKSLRMKTEVKKACIPTRVGCINRRVLDVSLGTCHSALLVEGGNIMMLGDNSRGQFGVGNTNMYHTPQLLKSLNAKTVCMIQCGDTYTVAGTMENAMYFWGTRHCMDAHFKPFSSKEKYSSSQDTNSESNSIPIIENVDNDSIVSVLKIETDKSAVMQELIDNGPDSPIMTVRSPERKKMKQNSSSSLRNGKLDFDNNILPSKDSADVISQPQEMLALYASPTQIAKGEVVNLARIQCFECNMFLVVDTTAPLPLSAHQKKSVNDKYISLSDKSSDSELKPHELPSNRKTTSSNTEMDTTTSVVDNRDCEEKKDDFIKIPSWLQEEIEESEKLSNGGKILQRNKSHSPQKKHGSSNYHHEMALPGSAGSDRSAHSPSQSSVTSPEIELKNELDKISKEKEFVEKRMIELEMKLNEQESPSQSSSDNKQREEELNAEIIRLQEQLSLRSSVRSDYFENSWSPKRKPYATNSKMCNIQ